MQAAWKKGQKDTNVEMKVKETSLERKKETWKCDSIRKR